MKPRTQNPLRRERLSRGKREPFMVLLLDDGPFETVCVFVPDLAEGYPPDQSAIQAQARASGLRWGEAA